MAGQSPHYHQWLSYYLDFCRAIALCSRWGWRTLDRQAPACDFGIEPEPDVRAPGRRVVLERQPIAPPSMIVWGMAFWQPIASIDTTAPSKSSTAGQPPT
jgi:hypothetical protein